MADSEFWRSIAAKFRSIFDVPNGMRVRWQCTDGAPNIAWEILNEPTPESKMQFFRLAKIAGRNLLSDSPDPFSVWMLKMRETRPNQHVETRTFESSDGTLSITEIGLILDVVRASANLCDELELEAQLAEQRRRDRDAFVERFESMVRQSPPVEPPRSPAAIARTPEQIPEPPDTEDLGISTRENRLQNFISTEKVTIADIRRAASVFKANMQQWRRGDLSNDSAMSLRIENVLNGKTPVQRRGKKKG